MKNRLYGASYQCALNLIAAGCPVDYPEALLPRSPARRGKFRAEQLTGHTESRIHVLNPLQTNYVIGLRLGTDRPGGTVISDWSFMPPWQDHWVNFDYDPEEFIREENPETYKTLVDGRLMRVLNEGALLRRGYPGHAGTRRGWGEPSASFACFLKLPGNAAKDRQVLSSV
jgi:hypothetical protein